MLRLIVVLLTLANVAFFAWQQGWLDAMAPGGADTVNGKAHLAQQVRPDRLIVLGSQASAASAATQPAGSQAEAASTAKWGVTSKDPQAASSAAAASVANTPADARCVEAGPFTPDENRTALQQLGKVLPKGAWTTQAVSVPGLWLVYMGPYPDAEALQRKLLELRRLKNLSFEEVRSPSDLALGVALGRFADERQANAALETMRLRGVRTARVVNARPSMELLVQRVPQASQADQAKLNALPLPAGKGFIACAG
jgi:hypothetical protein